MPGPDDSDKEMDQPNRGHDDNGDSDGKPESADSGNTGESGDGSGTGDNGSGIPASESLAAEPGDNTTGVPASDMEHGKPESSEPAVSTELAPDDAVYEPDESEPVPPEPITTEPVPPKPIREDEIAGSDGDGQQEEDEETLRLIAAAESIEPEPEKRKPGRPPGSKNKPKEPVPGEQTAASEIKTDDVPDKFKRGPGRPKGSTALKKGEKPKRKYHYMSEALAAATKEDKEVVKKHYTKFVEENLDLGPLLPAAEACALHIYMYTKNLADPPWWMSGVGAGAPLIGAIVMKRMKEKNNPKSYECPVCGVAKGIGCHDPRTGDKAPENVYHTQRYIVAGRQPPGPGNRQEPNLRSVPPEKPKPAGDK